MASSPDILHCFTGENVEKYLKLKLLVCGQSGSGKSSLINSIIGRQVCEVGDPGNADWVPEKAFSRKTTEIKATTAHISGTIVEIWDSPGLQDDSDDTFLRSMSDKCKDVDLLFYCIDCSTARWIEHEKTLKFMVGNFENTIWKKCILVLTKANMIYVPAQERSDKRRFHERVHQQFLLQFRKQLVNEGLPRDIIDSIPSVSAGIIEGEDCDESQRWLHYVSEKMFTTQKDEPSDFLAELWLTCLETLDELGRAKFLNITKEKCVHNYDDSKEESKTEAKDEKVPKEKHVHNYDDGKECSCESKAGAKDEKELSEIHAKVNEILAKVNEIQAKVNEIEKVNEIRAKVNEIEKVKDKVKEMYDRAMEPQELPNASVKLTEEQDKRFKSVIGKKTIAACQIVGGVVGVVVGAGLGFVSTAPLMDSIKGAVDGGKMGASAGKQLGEIAKKGTDMLKKIKKNKETQN